MHYEWPEDEFIRNQLRVLASIRKGKALEDVTSADVHEAQGFCEGMAALKASGRDMQPEERLRVKAEYTPLVVLREQLAAAAQEAAAGKRSLGDEPERYRKLLWRAKEASAAVAAAKARIAAELRGGEVTAEAVLKHLPFAAREDVEKALEKADGAKEKKGVKAKAGKGK